MMHADLFKCSLSEEVSFDARQRLVRVVISLLYETKLLSLRLVQSTLHTNNTPHKGKGKLHLIQRLFVRTSPQKHLGMAHIVRDFTVERAHPRFYL